MKISVIVPCYNQAQYLPETIQCLLSQTMDSWECIIVDDGSTDQTKTIAQSLADTDSRIKVFSVENGGSSKARQFGLAQAKGEYIQFLDSDDLIAPEKFEKQICIMEQTGVMASYTNFCFFRDTQDGRQYSSNSVRTLTITKSFLFSLLTRWGVNFTIPIHSFIYNREFALRIFPSNNTYRCREDWNMHIAVAKAGVEPICMTDYVGAMYRQNPSGKTSTPFRISEGNIHFIVDKRKELNISEQMLWAYRLSSELWLLAGRIAKYRDLSGIRCLHYMFHSVSSFLFFLWSLFLLPISLFFIIKRTIEIYR